MIETRRGVVAVHALFGSLGTHTQMGASQFAYILSLGDLIGCVSLTLPTILCHFAYITK